MALSASAFSELIHAERARFATLLGELSDGQWRSSSLGTDWTIEQVAVHLTAAGNTGTLAWLSSLAVIMAGLALVASGFGVQPGEWHPRIGPANRTRSVTSHREDVRLRRGATQRDDLVDDHLHSHGLIEAADRIGRILLSPI